MTLSGRSALFVVIGGIASLCVSLFLIGLLVGGVWRDHPHRPWGDGPMAYRDGPGDGRPGGKGGFLMMPVPPEIREQLKSYIEPHEAEIDKTRQAMREARQAVAKQLAAEPFDPDAFKSALENMQQQGAAAQKLMHDLLLETVPKLSPDLRKRWADRWMSPHMDGPPPPPGDAPPPDQP
jgi:Spy/CpxP family protein refolding chaperone